MRLSATELNMRDGMRGQPVLFNPLICLHSVGAHIHGSQLSEFVLHGKIKDLERAVVG